MITKICLQCRKEFEVYPYRKNTVKYCSYKCYWKSLKGKKLSIEHKKNVSKSLQGHIISEETKGKIGKANSIALKGKKLSEKTKEKLSIFHKGKHPINEFQSGSKHPMWKGGIRKSKGRLFIYKPNHPFATKQNYVRQSRLIAEKCLGRYLTREEVIHHINGIKDDDKPENLYLFAFQSKHIKYEFLKNKPILQSNLL